MLRLKFPQIQRSVSQPHPQKLSTSLRFSAVPTLVFAVLLGLGWLPKAIAQTAEPASNSAHLPSAQGNAHLSQATSPTWVVPTYTTPSDRLANVPTTQISLDGGNGAIVPTSDPQPISLTSPDFSALNPPTLLSQTPTSDQSLDLETLRQQLLLPDREPIINTFVTPVAKGAPANGIGIPNGFGANWRDVFLGASFQQRTRFSRDSDAGFGIGMGFGDARRSVGLEVAVSSFSTIKSAPFETGGFSFKFHRLLDDTLSVAVGVESLVRWSGSDTQASPYGVISKVFSFNDDPEAAFSALSLTLGVGGGRFRSIEDVNKDVGSINVFGGAALRVARPLSFIAEWSGQDLDLGFSIAPFPNSTLTITPAVFDVTNHAGDGARFGVGLGYAFHF